MVSVSWCLKQKQGIKIVDESENLCRAYFKMADESLSVMEGLRGKSKIFSVSSAYYAVYYSLYAVMQRIGIKCEIHTCSIEFMKRFLDFYSKEDINFIEKAFKIRNTLQYYADVEVSDVDIGAVLNGTRDFVFSSKKILSKLTSEKIKSIRRALENEN